MTVSRNDYEAIALMDPAEDGSLDQDHDRAEAANLGRKRHTPPSKRSLLPPILFVLAVLVSTVSLLWSVSNLIHLPWQKSAGYEEADSRVLDVDALRRPSQYMGLEKVPDVHMLEGVAGHHEHVHGDVDNEDEDEHEVEAAFETYPGGPIEVARMSSRYPYFTSKQDGWVLLTEYDRVMMKYASPPHGVSTCQLSSFFPTRQALGTQKLLTLEYDDKGTHFIEVIHHTTSSSSSSGSNVDLSKLTWNARPQGTQGSTTLKSLVAEFGVNSSTMEFPCNEGEDVLIELGCLGNACRVEYQVEGGDPRLGIELTYIYR